MRALFLSLAILATACSPTSVPVAAGLPTPQPDATSGDDVPEVPLVCTPGSTSCDEDEVWGCNDTGTARILIEECRGQSTCEGGTCVCVPNCTGKACGADGCGGSCGGCGDTGTCMADFSCCARGCEDRQCGPDACGGICGTCVDSDVCLEDTGLCCVPDCDGKTCGHDGCGGSCGECADGVTCPLGGVCGCEPQCEGMTCGVDGCGELCGGCFAYEEDDGSTETAYGYPEPPAVNTTAVACMVRIELPHTAMRLTSFTAGWMYGLWDLGLPFELVVAPAEEMACQLGDDNTWWAEACVGPETALTALASLVPFEPYAEQLPDDLERPVMPSSEIFIGARFLITEYPIYVCPVDSSGEGQDSFMFPVSLVDGVATMNAAALKTAHQDIGALAFRFLFELTEDSLPVEDFPVADAPADETPETP